MEMIQLGFKKIGLKITVIDETVETEASDAKGEASNFLKGDKIPF